MHPEALDFFRNTVFGSGLRLHLDNLGAHTSRSQRPLRILEIGSRNINGSLRDIPNLQDLIGPYTWTGVDLTPGPNVDICCDFLDYFPEDKTPFDIILCAEVLEHYKAWPALLVKASLHMHEGSFLAVSAAGSNRQPHACDGSPTIPPNETYKNIPIFTLAAALTTEFDSLLVTGARENLDVYAIAWNPIHPGTNTPSTPGDSQ